MFSRSFLAILITSFSYLACSPGVGADPAPDAGTIFADAAQTAPDARVDEPQDPRQELTGTAELRAITSAGVLTSALEGSETLEIYTGSDWHKVQVDWTDATHFRAELDEGAKYYLRYGDEWIVSTRGSIDLSRFLLGRSDRTACDRPATMLELDATLLSPWNDTDELQLVSANTGAMVFNLQALAWANAPRAGHTALDAMRVRWIDTEEALIDGSMGDQLVLTQLVEKSSGTRKYRAAARAMIPSAFRMIDGETTTVSGAFDAPAVNETLSMRLDPMRRRAWAGDLNPSAVHAGGSLYVDAMPFGGEHGQIGATPDLAVMSIPTTETAPFDVTLDFANVFPASWKLFVQSADNFWVSILAENAAQPLDVLLAISSNNDYDAVARGAGAVQVGPVREIRIDDKPGFSRNRLDTATPTIQWTAPESGVANLYGVTVYRVYADGAQTALEHRAGFVLESTSLALPPGVLVSGESYVFLISAHDLQDADAITHPYAARFPESYAESLTGLVTIAN